MYKTKSLDPVDQELLVHIATPVTQTGAKQDMMQTITKYYNIVI